MQSLWSTQPILQQIWAWNHRQSILTTAFSRSTTMHPSKICTGAKYWQALENSNQKTIPQSMSDRSQDPGVPWSHLGRSSSDSFHDKTKTGWPILIQLQVQAKMLTSSYLKLMQTMWKDSILPVQRRPELAKATNLWDKAKESSAGLDFSRMPTAVLLTYTLSSKTSTRRQGKSST